MPKRFDTSKAYSDLGRLLKQIGDTLTSSKEINDYEEFNAALYIINGLTEEFYRPKKDGTYKQLTPVYLKQFKDAYNKAIEQAEIILSKEANSSVEVGMKTITREILPLLMSDKTAFDMVDIEKGPKSLPEIIAKARESAVDLGEQEAPTVGGKLNKRMHINVVTNGEVESGFFTPTTIVKPSADYKKLLNTMEVKYPEYKKLIDALRKINVKKAAEALWQPNYERLDSNLSLEEQKEKVIDIWFEMTLKNLNIHELAMDYIDRPDFLRFMGEMERGMAPIKTQVETYMDGMPVKMEEGTNLDKRNVAMTRVADMLGLKGLVAESRPMMVIQNGVEISGTFMKEAYGSNIANLSDDDPLLNITADNLENPVVSEQIAATQVLDFLTGNLDRNPANFFMRFSPDSGPNSQLVGLTLIDNDFSFTDTSLQKLKGTYMVMLDQMGVIGEEVYNSIVALTEDQLKILFKDCGLSDAELMKMLERRQALIDKVEEDKEYFEGKEAGYTEVGKIRLVSSKDWTNYSIKALADKHKKSFFNTISEMPETAKSTKFTSDHEVSAMKLREDNRNKVLELKKPEEKKKPNVPTGITVGTGLIQGEGVAIDPNADVLKLGIPALSKVKSVGGQISKRYAVSWMEDGVEKQGFFTPAEEYVSMRDIDQIYNMYIEKYPEYRSELMQIKNYLTVDDINDIADISDPLTQERLEDMGFGKKEAEKLLNDKKFNSIKKNLASDINTYGMKVFNYSAYGIVAGDKNRIDLRNSAMSDIEDAIGVSNLVAKSRIVQIDAGGQLINGVVMDKVDGVDFSKVKAGHPVTKITADKAKTVYNNPDGVKSIADLQIIDYICLNVDRHFNNFIYRFEGLDTDNPKFLGVTGIDNDFSMGTDVPEADSEAKELPALNKMQVISKEMVDGLEDGSLLSRIKEKCDKNGSSKEEYEAVVKRIENIKTAVKDGRLRVVKKDEWGKNNNSIEALSKEGYFKSIKIGVIDTASKMAENYYKLPENERPVYQPSEELVFTKAAVLDDISQNAKDNEEFKEMEIQARKDFRKYINDIAKTAPPAQAKTEKEVVKLIYDSADTMLNQLDSANPWNHSTSTEYKNIIKACKSLKKLAKSYDKKLTSPESELNNEQRYNLIKLINNVTDCSKIYEAKKEREKKEGRKPSDVGKARILMSKTTEKTSNKLGVELFKAVMNNEAQKSPLKFAHAMVRADISKAKNLSGESLRKCVSAIIYFKTLTEADYSKKRGDFLKNAVQYDTAELNKKAIMNTPGFKHLAQLPDDELRNLVSKDRGEALVQAYTKGVAKEKQEQKKKEVRNKALENNKKKNDMKK